MVGSAEGRYSTLSQLRTVPIESLPIFTPKSLLVVSVTMTSSEALLALSLEDPSMLKPWLRYRPQVAEATPELGVAHSDLAAGPLGNEAFSALVAFLASGFSEKAVIGLAYW